MFYASTQNQRGKTFLRYDAFEKIKKELGLKPVNETKKEEMVKIGFIVFSKLSCKS
jgi:hypothetical protein